MLDYVTNHCKRFDAKAGALLVVFTIVKLSIRNDFWMPGQSLDLGRVGPGLCLIIF